MGSRLGRWGSHVAAYGSTRDLGDFLSIVVADTCLIAGYSLIYAAVRRFRCFSYNTDILLVPVAVTFIFFWYFLWTTSRTGFFLSRSFLFCRPAELPGALLRHVPVKERLSHWLTGFGFFVMALLLLNRFMRGSRSPMHNCLFCTRRFSEIRVCLRCSALRYSQPSALHSSAGGAEEDRRESGQRWATTLASIGDAGITANVEGKITFMNAVAEGLTGWTLKEAVKKQVTEVCNMVNEQTRKSARTLSRK